MITAGKILRATRTWHSLTLFAWALLNLVPLVFAPAAHAQQSIVALVNDEPISAFDVEQRMRFVSVTAKEEMGPALKKKALEMLVDERLQLQAAKNASIVVDEADVSKLVAEMAQRNNLSEAGLAQALGQMGVNIKTLKDRIRANVAWQQVVRRKFRGSVVVADAEIEKLVAETASAGANKATGDLQVQQVKLDAPANDDQAMAAKLAEAEQLRSRFKSCDGLGELVKGVQGATVRSVPGSTDQLPQPAKSLVQSAKVGQVTPVNIMGNAVEFYAICGRKAVKDDPKTRDEAERKLMMQEYGLQAKRLLRDMRHDAFIEYR